MVQNQTRTCLFILFLAVASQITGQTHIIDGIVYDDSDEIVQFAYVFTNQDSTNSTFTDIDGKFEISSETHIEKLTFHEGHIYFSVFITFRLKI